MRDGPKARRPDGRCPKDEADRPLARYRHAVGVWGLRQTGGATAGDAALRDGADAGSYDATTRRRRDERRHESHRRLRGGHRRDPALLCVRIAPWMQVVRALERRRVLPGRPVWPIDVPPQGCCTGLGECIEPPGGHGVRLGRGAAARVCDAGPCMDSLGCATVLFSCGPANCAGCCIGNDEGRDAAQAACLTGTSGEFCGHGGQNCEICGPGEACRPIGFDAGRFRQANDGCDPTTRTGCCVDGVCAQGDQAIACGVGGAACKSCGDGGVCMGGDCACGPPFFPTCPDD